MPMNKTGRFGTGMIEKAIMGIILLVVLFTVYATLLPEAQTAGDTLNASGVPFGNLFVGSGVVFIIIMVALVILVVRQFLKTGKK